MVTAHVECEKCIRLGVCPWAAVKRGPAELGRIRDAFAAWGDEHEYDSVQEMRGTICLARGSNPKTFERGNYRQALRASRPLNFSGAGH